MCANIAATQTSSSQEWLTPLWLFNLLDQEFHFTLDVAATDNNTLCDTWFTKEQNGLKQKWVGRAFCNPPYSQMRQWVQCAWQQVAARHCELAVVLVAARTDTRAWWEYIRYQEVRFLPGRLKFEHEDGARYSAPFPSAVVIFRQGDAQNKTVYWDVREPKEK